MKVVIAIDSFKGSLTSLQAGNAVKDAIKRLDKNANILVKPLADGGEGTVKALASGLDSEIIELTVKGPLLTPVVAQYCILKDTNTAVIEMASASGITLISLEERNPLKTTTYGVGELIKDAIKKGCRRFIVGIGGSATNDGGTGMLTALGYEFLDKNNNPIAPGAIGLKDLCKIKTDKVMPELKECSFNIACDVTNPLCGENGCSAVFGPQKGATPQMISDMDAWLEAYALLSKTVAGKADKNYAGAGAAGGLGFAFVSYLNASLESGIDLILRKIKLEDAVINADIVITGEGCLDAQSIMGKAPVGVAKLAKKYDKPVIAFCGIAKDENIICNNNEIDAYFPILRNICISDDAMNPENAKRNLAFTAQQVFRIIDKFMK